MGWSIYIHRFLIKILSLLSISCNLLQSYVTMQTTNRGYTNHQDAINFCNNQFPNDENSKNIIVLVTDGVPTRPGEGQEPSIFGLEAAEDAKNDGALILPVFVTTSYTGDQYDNSISYMQDISNAGTDPATGQDKIWEATDFDDLANLVSQVAGEGVLCPTISPKPSSSVSPTVSMVPTSPPSCVNLNNYECTPFNIDTFDTSDYSIITKEDTVSAAKNVYKKMYVGGNLSNPSSSTVTVGGHVYYGSITEPINTNFNGGMTKLSDLPPNNPPIDFEYYEWLATHIEAGSFDNGYEVILVTQPKGSCYNMYDFLGTAAQGSNNGKTLIVFTFDDDVCLTKTPDGRQFGPSVLAPFSKVTLTNAGYLDGIVIAKSFTTVMNGSNGSEQQLHGVSYDG